MKVLAIGDTHGRQDWKKIVKENPDVDRYVFIGDYFDSFNIPYEQQIDNFRDIVQFKLHNIEKVVLLIGNHDFHYLSVAKESYSGFQEDKALEINAAVYPLVHNGIMQMAFEQDGVLYTHAGVTKTWFKSSGSVLSSGNVEQAINSTFKENPESFRFNGTDSYGDNITQSPIWVRPNSLLADQVTGIKQVVGHTAHLMIVEDLYKNIYFIDTLGTSKEYLLVTDGIPEIKK